MTFTAGTAPELEPNARAQVLLSLEPGLYLLHIASVRGPCASQLTAQYQASFMQRFCGVKDRLHRIARF
jgi:hypothetical protein